MFFVVGEVVTGNTLFIINNWGERERENSELYYTRTEILGSSVLLQSVITMPTQTYTKIIANTIDTHKKVLPTER